MKGIKLAFLFLFSLMLLAPLAAFRWEPGIASEIDNRMLQEFPFSSDELSRGGDLTNKIEAYVSDRIGFRDQMISGFIQLNDKLFGKMVHPSYCYGQEGYVFFKMGQPVKYGAFHEAFADMVKKIQDYCEARDVPFLFAFEPSKTTILQEYLPAGVNYDAGWIDTFFEALDVRGIRYVDNRSVIQNRWDAGEMVFNRQYDAGHWNDLGAFYGVNAILEELQKDFPGIHVNTMEEIRVSEVLRTTLPVSKFPIQEQTPRLSFPNIEMENYTDVFTDEVRRSYQSFGYYVNSERRAQGSPRALVFQGSYMNGYGGPFLLNSLGEYIWIHNYQNVMDFDYYFNIFQPECVVFEVTEYAMTSDYFNFDRVAAISLNPVLDSVRASAEESEYLPLEGITVERGEALTRLLWTGEPEWTSESGETPYVWAVLSEAPYDMRQSDEGGWEVTVKNEDWDKTGGTIGIAILENEETLTLLGVWSEGSVSGPTIALQEAGN